MISMTARQRGATWFVAVLLLGRLLDALDLPFESRLDSDRLHLGAHEAAPDSLSAAAGTGSRDSLDVGAPAVPLRATQPIAVNEASARELQALPRVGPVLAARIVEWRQANGPFQSVQDLERVPGIGARTAAQLAPLVRFD